MSVSAFSNDTLARFNGNCSLVCPKCNTAGRVNEISSKMKSVPQYLVLASVQRELAFGTFILGKVVTVSFVFRTVSLYFSAAFFVITVVPTSQIYLERSPPASPLAAVHTDHDGILHRTFSCVGPQTSPHRCTGRLYTRSPGGILYSKSSILPDYYFNKYL